MLDAQIVLQTIGHYLVNENTCQFKVLLEFFSLLDLLLITLKDVGIHIRNIYRSEEIEERFCLNLFSNDSLLSCFFVFLFLLDFFQSKIASNPLNHSSLRLNWSIIFQEKFLAKLFVLDDLVFLDVKYNSEIVASFFFIDHSNIGNASQERLVVFTQVVLYHIAVLKTFKPVSIDLSGVQMLVHIFFLIFGQILIQVVELLLLYSSLSFNKF